MDDRELNYEDSSMVYYKNKRNSITLEKLEQRKKELAEYFKKKEPIWIQSHYENFLKIKQNIHQVNE